MKPLKPLAVCYTCKRPTTDPARKDLPKLIYGRKALLWCRGYKHDVRSVPDPTPAER